MNRISSIALFCTVADAGMWLVLGILMYLDTAAGIGMLFSVGFGMTALLFVFFFALNSATNPCPKDLIPVSFEGGEACVDPKDMKSLVESLL